jgi:hypothetical protein
MKNGFPAPNKEPAKNQKQLLDSAGWLAETVAHCRRLVRRRERPFLIGVSGSAVAAGWSILS